MQIVRPFSLDLTAISNICTDVVAHVEPEFLERFGLRKSCATEIDLKLQNELFSALPDRRFIPGGVGSNIAQVISSLGGKAEALMAKSVELYIFCLITPDGDRSFANYIPDVSAGDQGNYDPEKIQHSALIFLDGYTLFLEGGFEVLMQAADQAAASRRPVCFNPCDLSMIERYPEQQQKLLGVSQMLICNLAEAAALYGDLSAERLAENLVGRFAAGAVTDGANGAWAFAGGELAFIAPADITRIPEVDTNGAGDHFAGGFLYGMVHQLPLSEAGALGQLCAQDCLSHPGARPLGSLMHLLSQAQKI